MILSGLFFLFLSFLQNVILLVEFLFFWFMEATALLIEPLPFLNVLN